jgi:hypothetical protein
MPADRAGATEVDRSLRMTAAAAVGSRQGLHSAESDHFDDRDRTGGPDPLQTFAPEFCIS